MVDVVFGGKFQNWGIMEFDESEIRNNGCGMILDVQTEWPAEAHVLIVKEPNGGRLNPTIKENPRQLGKQSTTSQTPQVDDRQQLRHSLPARRDETMKAAEAKRKLIDESVRLIVEQGLAGRSFREMARRAGMSRQAPKSRSLPVAEVDYKFTPSRSYLS